MLVAVLVEKHPMFTYSMLQNKRKIWYDVWNAGRQSCCSMHITREVEKNRRHRHHVEYNGE